MLTKEQIKKFFQEDGEWEGDPSSDYEAHQTSGIDYSTVSGVEAICNDYIRFDLLQVNEDGTQRIWDADEERWLVVSKGATFQFYKITKERVE